MQGWGKRQLAQGQLDNNFDYLIPEWVQLIYDDCPYSDFITIEEVEPHLKSKKASDIIKLLKNHQPIEVFKKEYFVKPTEARLGYGFDNHRKIFTTTEAITKDLILARFKSCYVPDLMPPNKMLAGNITIFKTDFTGSKKDGLLLPLFERVKREGFTFKVIADALGQELNHTNNKGQNRLSDENVVIELSQPNFIGLYPLLYELDMNEKDIHTLKVLVALDQLHQAIGRVRVS